MKDSVACMMNLKNSNFGSVPVLEPLGVALPILKDFFSDEGRLKILAMMKAVLVLYILTMFIDSIPGISSDLMGGNQMPTTSGMDPTKLTKRVAGILGSIQKRGAGAGKIAGGKVGSEAKSVGSQLAPRASNVASQAAGAIKSAVKGGGGKGD